MKKTLFLFFILFQSLVAFSQEPAFQLDLKTVDVVEERKPKVVTIGKHKAFTIFLKTFSLQSTEETAVFLSSTDTNSYWIQKAFIRLCFDKKPKREVPVILRFRAVLPDTIPGEIILQDTINLMENLNGKVLEADVEDKYLSLNSGGIFLSIEVLNQEDKEIISLEAGSQNKYFHTYARRIYEPSKWDKETFTLGNNPWYLKAGLQLIQK